jgi:hypothetical protein
MNRGGYMKLSVLVMSDGMVKQGKGELFDRLFGEGFKKVWCVGLEDAAENYAETDEDWDVVIVHNEHGDGLVADILEMNGQQVVIVMNEQFTDPVRTAYGFDLPSNAEMLKSTLERFLGIPKR